jgi:hypothetical protein
MPAISQVIANLFNGVSQQPPVVRSPTQAEDILNMDATLANGLRRRFGTTKGATSDVAIEGDYQWIPFEDSSGAFWFIVVGSLGVYVLNNSGVSQTVTNWNTAYCVNSTPRTNIRLAVKDQQIYILNRTTTVATVATGVALATNLEVQTFDDLPTVGSATTVYTILGTSFGAKSYYVTWDGDNYIETSLDVLQKPTSATMPHILEQVAGVWTVQTAVDWVRPLAGSAAADPQLSLVANKIVDIFFWRNRLGLMTNFSINLSRVGDSQWLYPQTTSAVLDDDPIDVKIGGWAGQQLLYHALPFNDNLLLFSDSAQYQMTSDGPLTPSTVRVDPTTSYATSQTVRPIPMGQFVYFLTPSTSGFMRLREYHVVDNAVSADATDLTSHCPRLITTAASEMVADPEGGGIIIRTPGTAGWLYRTQVNDNGERIQSAVLPLEFTHPVQDTENNGMAFAFGYLLMGSRLPGDIITFLTAKIPYENSFGEDALTGETIRYELHMDSITNAPTVPTTSAGNTLVPRPTGYRQGMVIFEFQTGRIMWDERDIDPLDFVDGTVTLIGDDLVPLNRSPVPVIDLNDLKWGYPFDSRFVPSQFFARDRNGVPKIAGRLQVRALDVFVEMSAELTGTVEAYTKASKVRYSPSYQMGIYDIGINESLSTRRCTIPIGRRSDILKITLSTDGILPLTISSLVWKGVYNQRTQ